jgi:hypothetical protein
VTYDTVTLVGGSAISKAYQPLAAGSYEFQVVYAGDANYEGITSMVGSEPLNVLKAASVTATDLGTSSILLGDSVFDVATVTGLGSPFSVPSGTIDFQVQFNSGAWASFDSLEVLADGTVTSTQYFPAASGNYQFRAVYSGDDNYLGSQSADGAEPLSVGLAPSVTSTYLGTSNIVLGDSVSDYVTVVALDGLLGVPTGTVTFQVSLNGGAYVPYDSNVPLVGGTATSTPYQPQVAGNYQFQALYSGDNVFSSSMSVDGDEPLIVEGAPTTTSTQLTDSSIALGDLVYDTATVTGIGAPFPALTGTVTFEVSFNNGVFSPYDAQDVSTGIVTSNSYIPEKAGDYRFRAAYGGDTNNLKSQSGDGDEPLTVTKAPSFSLTTMGTTEIVVGQSVFDNVTVTNLVDSLPVPTGSVSFQVNVNNNGFVEYDTATLVNGVAKSARYDPLAAGSYEFQAVYGGDANFLGSTSMEGSEPLSVAKAPTTTGTSLDSSSILLGDLVYDTATVTGPGNPFPVPTGTINFQVRYNGGAWTSYDTGLLVDGTVTSSAYTPSDSGNYNFRCLYSGDGNYLNSMSGDSSEPLSVGKAASDAITSTGIGTIVLGQSVFDNVTVIALADSLPVPTGTVDFQVSFEGGAYSVYDGNVPLVNGEAMSAKYTPLAAGNYQFQAVYSGDGVFEQSSSLDGGEPVTVDQAASVTSTDLGTSTILLGDSVFDNAKVAGLGSPFPVPKGTIDFQYRFNSGAWTSFDAGAVLVDGKVTSEEFFPSAVGPYEFRARYGGDSNYLSSSSGDADEPLAVDYAPSWTSTDLGVSQIDSDQMVYDNASVIAMDGLLPVPTGTVTFEVSVNGGAFVAYDTNVPLVNGAAKSTWYDPIEDGTYLFRAVYSGDDNFAKSVSFEEVLMVGLNI